MATPHRPRASDPLAAEERWLSLGAASKLLGVHSTTLRRWSDAGRVPCRRTAGGHRRYPESRLRALAGSSASDGAGPGAAEAQPWHAAFAAAGLVDPLREVGQRLSGIVVQALARPGDLVRHRAQCHAAGGQYATASRAAGIDLLTAVEAYTYYRATFSHVVAQISPRGTGHPMDPRYESLMNEVLLGLVAGYGPDEGTV